jgi:antitoxin (DNA-binding transcriptional repressor) of toxin-antitoxin stability system
MNMRMLRSGLAAALRRAEAGERIVVTVGGRAVAQLGPVETLATDAQPTLDDLAARGLVIRARRTDPPTAEVVVALPVGARLDRLVAEIRT